MEVLPCKFPNKKSGVKSNGQDSLQNKSNKKKKNQEQGIARDHLDKDFKFDQQKLYNKIEDNFHVNNKKALYLNMKNYYDALEEDVFDYLPLTFHVKAGLEDPEFLKFQNKYY